MDSKLHRETIYRKVKHAVRLTQEQRYADALPLFEMYLPLLSSADEGEKRLLTLASSYCGLCLAKVRHRHREALEYCEISLAHEVTNPDHRANAALVYLERDDRRRAVRQLYAGLRLAPTNPRINRILDDIGRRAPPAFRFLKRSHPLNIWLGRRRHLREQRRRTAR